MIHRVLAIALNTYRESVRARILIGLTGVAFAVAFYSLIIGAYTLKYAQRVVSDVGAASISLFGVAVAIVIGATSLHRELEQKTLFPILARPVSRGEYLAGKYFGTLITIGVFIMANAGLVLSISGVLAGRQIGVAIGAVALSAAIAVAWGRAPRSRTFLPIPFAIALLLVGVWASGGAPDERRVVLGASALAFLEVSIIAAVATLFSAFSTPFLSAVLTIGVFLIGRNTDALARFPVKTMGQGMHDFGVFLSKIWPNLHVYVPPRPLLTGEAIGADLPSYLGMASVAAVAWSAGLLAAASLLFKRRDFL